MHNKNWFEPMGFRMAGVSAARTMAHSSFVVSDGPGQTRFRKYRIMHESNVMWANVMEYRSTGAVKADWAKQKMCIERSRIAPLAGLCGVVRVIHSKSINDNTKRKQKTRQQQNNNKNGGKCSGKYKPISDRASTSTATMLRWWWWIIRLYKFF